MALKLELAQQSVLDLVACDFAYKRDAQISLGETLPSFPDSRRSEDEQAFPDILRSSLPAESSQINSLFHSNPKTDGGGIAYIEFDNWVVDKTFDIQGDGFGAVVFRTRFSDTDGKNEYIVAFRGTDGLDQQDWFANIDLAKTEWQNDGQNVVDYLLRRPDAKKVHFTGQSLGGGLAQYAAYDYALQFQSQRGVAFDPRAVSLTTFNGFGAVSGLQSLRGYNPRLLAEISTAHFATGNDIVHLLGGGNPADLGVSVDSWHVNGNGNEYQLDFLKIANGSPVLRPDGQFALPNVVDAHRIESGFYRGFKNSGQSFASAGPTTFAYLDLANSQVIIAAMSRIMNNGLTTPLSATARLFVAAVAAGLAATPREINVLSGAFGESLRQASELPGLASVLSSPAPGLIVGLLRLVVGKSAIVLAAGSIAFAKAAELVGLNPNDKTDALSGVNDFLSADSKLSNKFLASTEAAVRLTLHFLIEFEARLRRS